MALSDYGQKWMREHYREDYADDAALPEKPTVITPRTTAQPRNRARHR